jgi:hypothetical protein
LLPVRHRASIRFRCGWGPSFDGYGRVLMPLYDGGVLQVHAWDPNDDSWSPRGRPMINVGSAHFERERDFETTAGSLRTLVAQEPFEFEGMSGLCDALPWDEQAPGVVSGGAYQVIGGDPSIVEVFTEGYISNIIINDEGTCIGWITENDPMVREIGSDDELVAIEQRLYSLD